MTMSTIKWSVALVSLAALAACTGEASKEPPGSARIARKNIQEVEPATAAFPPKAGQTIYIPVYSSVSISDRPHNFNLAINVTFRNTDPKSPVILKSARYFDGDGTLVREFTPRPIRVGPLASADFFVNESDKAGGRGACFVIDWIADQPVADALAESVMVGTANTQGVSFSCAGHVVSDLRRP